MFRALSIIAAIAALAVSAAPVASAHNQPFDDGAGNAAAGLTKAAPPKAGRSKARVGGKMHLEDISLGVKHYGQSSSASGIIMSDGRICNPRWGC